MKKLLNNPVSLCALMVAGAAAILAIGFPAEMRALFSTGPFMPHVHCYLDDPRMIWLHVATDVLIGLAYVSISSTLAYLVYKSRRSIPFHWMFLAFGLFIVSCGFTHFMEVLTVWHPYYWLAGAVKAVTAVASVVTALALFPLVPKVFAMLHAVKVSEDRRIKLLAANRELEAFAYSISHDLRAPLRTMQGMALALQQDYASQMDPMAQVYAKKIVGASERMDRLILDLLEYSRLNLSQFELSAIALQPVLDDVLASIAANVKERDAQLALEGRFPAVLANRSLLAIVLTNLLTNAIKFVPKGTRPRIIVAAEVRDQIVRISVTDNGIGIAPEHQDRIFKIFERLHPATEYPGTGVGLAIVQRAVVRMGGAVGLRSELGKGSSFWIDLPLSATTGADVRQKIAGIASNHAI